MERNILLGIVVVVIIAGAAGFYLMQNQPDDTNGEPGPGPTDEEIILYVGHTVDADTLDPQTSGMMVAGDVIMTMFDSLLVRDMNGDIQPHLAESYTFSEDGTKLTLKLREGVQYHCGTPFNASGVAYSLDRLFDPETASGQLATIKDVIKEWNVISEYEIELVLHNPDILILDQLTADNFALCPKCGEEHGVEEFGLNPCGTGPFKFEEWIRDDHVTVVNNPDYNWAPPFTGHEGPANVDEIVFRVIPEPTVRVQAVQTGEIQICAWPPLNQIPEVRDDPNVEILEVQGSRIDFMSFNTLDERYPWNITEMRKAASHAIDKEAINTAAAMGLNVPAYSPCSPALMGSWYNDELFNYTNYDPELAGEMFDAEGWILEDDGWRYKDGVPLTVNLIEPSKKYADLLDVALVVKDNLEAVGVKVDFEDLDRDTWYSREVEGTFDMSAAGLGGATITGIKWFFDPAQMPWPNWMRVNDTELMYNINEGRKQTSVEDALPYFHEVQRIIVDEAYWDPIYYPTVFKIIHKDLSNLPHPPVAGGWIYLDVEIE
jgi:peptide/nickel transport system substrate-binding protein